MTIHNSDPFLFSQASLRRARWMHEAGRLEQHGIVEKYQEATRLSPEYVHHSRVSSGANHVSPFRRRSWESPLYYLGHYWDQLWKSIELRKEASGNSKDSKKRGIE